MKNIKHSRQRDAIVKFLSERKDHPTADIIYTNIRKQFPKISLGTVYRNLSLLEELGEIQRISCGDGMEHFDYDTSSHNHFICRKCKSITDLEMDSIDFINTLASKSFKGNIEGHKTFFYGICPKCAKKEKNTIDT